MMTRWQEENLIERIKETKAQEAYGIRPGDWIITEEGERMYFKRLSSTEHWGFFADSANHNAIECKLPLSGLRKA